MDDDDDDVDVAPKRKNPLDRFRKASRLVVGQWRWTKRLSKLIEEREPTTETEIRAVDGPRPPTLPRQRTFRVDDFKRSNQPRVALSQVDKVILSKPSWLREEDDLKEMTLLMNRLRCFSQYSAYVLYELSRVLYYEVHEKGKIVIRQGDPGFSFYFVVSGITNVEVTEIVKERRHSHIVGELKAGASFGELALLHDTKRRATIVCKTACEFLRVDKPDFETVLKKMHEQEWNVRFDCLRMHPVFCDWSKADVAMAAGASKTIEFKADTIILNDVKHKLDDVYFVTKGECIIARKIIIYYDNQVSSNGTKRLVAPLYRQKSANRRSVYKEKKLALVRIRILRAGDFFGVGEDLGDAQVIATSKAECLLVSRLAFMKHDRGVGLEKMRVEADERLPSNKVAYQCLIHKDRWATYKKKVLNDVIARKTSRLGGHAKLEDAPGFLAANQKRRPTTDLPPVRPATAPTFSPEPTLLSENNLAGLV